MLGVTSRTLRNWDYKGIIKVARTATNHRIIPISEVRRIQDKHATGKITIAYCRVSTHKQEENLERQIGRVLSYCVDKKWQVELYKDIGSGLNDKRKEFKKLIRRIAEGGVERIIVEYKDRIVRFGFETFVEYCSTFDVEVHVIEQSKHIEFEEELSQDIISLVTSYAARIHGRRGGKARKVA